MKATYEQLTEQQGTAFLHRQFSLPTFNAPFHFHPELELTYIKSSRGKRFVGRQVADFEAGDLVFLGSNVPHCWLNTEGSFDVLNASQSNEISNATLRSRHVIDAVNPSQSIVIQFKSDFLGDTFLGLSELSAIRQLFQKAQSGIFITGHTRDIVAEKMSFQNALSPFEKLMNLLDILNIIAVSDETELIDPQFSSYALSVVDTERFQKVFAYIIENYTQDIDLQHIAAIAHLTPTAFCRYFKKMTRKTLVEVITEFRIKHACQLLATTEKSVADICFESGFGNISYFNKTFKNEVKHNPLTYRKLFYKI